MVLENTEVLLFMHMGISTCANYAGSTNYYIYRQIFKGVSVEVKEQAQKSCRRDDTASCCGQYQMNSTAFCSRVVLSLDSTLWWSVKFIIHTWLAFYLILVRRSCCNLSTIEIIFFPNQSYQNLFVSVTILHGEYRDRCIPKTQWSISVKLFMFFVLLAVDECQILWSW